MTVLLEKHKYNSKRYAVDLRIALKQHIRVLIENVRRDYALVSVIRLSLGRRLVNLLPVSQRTNALTNGVVGRTMCRWS